MSREWLRADAVSPAEKRSAGKPVPAPDQVHARADLRLEPRRRRSEVGPPETRLLARRPQRWPREPASDRGGGASGQARRNYVHTLKSRSTCLTRSCSPPRPRAEPAATRASAPGSCPRPESRRARPARRPASRRSARRSGSPAARAARCGCRRAAAGRGSRPAGRRRRRRARSGRSTTPWSMNATVVTRMAASVAPASGTRSRIATSRPERDRVGDPARRSSTTVETTPAMTLIKQVAGHVAADRPVDLQSDPPRTLLRVLAARARRSARASAGPRGA